MNIKQIKLLSIIIIIVSILAGCSKVENNTINTSVITSEECIQSGFFSNDCRLVEGDDGYYIMDIINPYAISFIGKDTDERIYLCGKPDCAHMKDSFEVLPTCNSYVGQIILSSLTYHDGWLYMLSYDEGTYAVSLSRVSKDGAIHETLGEMGQAPYNDTSFSYLIEGDTVYYTRTPEWDDKEKTVSVLSMSLLTKEIKELYTFEDANSGMMNLKSYNGFLYLREYLNGVGMLSRIELATGEREVLVDSSISSYTINSSGNELLYWIPGEGLYKMSLNDLNLSLVRAGDSNTFYSELACDDTYIYISNYMNAILYDDATGERNMTILDLNGKQMGVIPLSEYRTMPLCITNDRVYFEVIIMEEGRKFAYIEKEKILDHNIELTMIKSP